MNLNSGLGPVNLSWGLGAVSFDGVCLSSAFKT